MDKSLSILSIKLFLSWLLMLVLFVLLGQIIFGGLSNISLSNLANWDGRHFLAIAQFGYISEVQYAFFPLYPLLINIISKILNINFLYGAILINLISFLGIIYVFLKLLGEYKIKNPTRILILFLIFPTSFFLIAVYSESLFLFFTLLTFYLGLKKHYYWAVLFASLACATRITGIAVVLGLLTQVYFSQTNYKEKIAVLFAPLGILLYCLYQFFQTGNPLYFLVSEMNWGRSISIPGTNIYATLNYIAHKGIDPSSYSIFSDLLFTVFGIGLGVRAIRFLRPPLAVFTITSLLIPLVTSLLLSMPRFLIIIFPIFILLGQIKNRIFQISYIIISWVLLFLYFNFFLRHIWVS